MPILTDVYLNYNPRLPKILYHYCSVEAFLSIIKNKCIWLSDADSTNDNRELNYVFYDFEKVLDKCLQDLDSKYDELKPIIKRLSLEVMKKLLSQKIPASQYTKHFLCCFSEAQDLLSQWRAYGDDGKGVAIGFNSRQISKMVCDETYGFTKVIYQKKKVRDFLYTTISDRLTMILEEFSKNQKISDSDTEQFMIDVATIVYAIWQEGFVYKHKSFKEEREWRIYKKTSYTNYCEDEGVDDYGYAGFLDGIFVANNKYCGDFTRSELKYRATSNNIRPYFEIGFDRCKDKMINQIVLGPKCKISDLNLRLLLAQYGYIDDVDSNAIKIIKADSSYV